MADFQVDVPLNLTVNVANGNAVNYSAVIGTLKLGDTNGNQTITFAKGNANSSRFHFTNNTGSVLIEKRGDGNDLIAVGSMRAYNNTFNVVFGGGTGTLTFDCEIAQQIGYTTRLNISGSGTLIIAGSAAFTHTAGTEINGATVQFNNDNRPLGVVPGALDVANVTIGNGATLRSGSNPNVNANRGFLLKGGGTASFTTVESTQTLTINGPISADSGSPSSVVVGGPGVISLLGANTYTTPTTVTGGTLALVAANHTGGGAITVADGAALRINASGSGQLNASDVTLGSLGQVNLSLDYGTLSGNPSNPALNVTGTFSPAAASGITINVSGTGFVAGQFPLIKYTGTAPNTSNMSLGTVTPGVIATLVHNTANSSIDLNISLVVNGLTWFAGVNDQWDIATSANWNSGTATYNEYGTSEIVGDVVLFDDTLEGTALRTNVNLTTTVRPAVINVANNTYGYVFGGAGKLSGTTILNKSGAAPLTLNTANDHTGVNTLTLGTVRVGDNSALGSGMIALAGGGISSASTDARTIGNPLRMTIATVFGDSVNNGPVTFSGALDFAGAGRDVTCHSEVIFTGSVGNGGLDQKLGPGTLRFNSVIGEMANGQVQIENGSVYFSGGVMNKSGGGIRVACTTPLSLSHLSISGGVLFTLSASGSNLRIGSMVDVIGDPSSTNIVDVSATLTWTTNNTTGGKIQMGGSCAFAQLNLTGGGYLKPATFVHEGNISEVNLDGGVLAPIASSATFMQGLTAVYVRSSGAIIDTDGKEITIGQSLLDGGGAGGLTKNSAGKLTLTGTNTYTGPTMVNGGTLIFGPANLAAGDITVADGAVGGFLATGTGVSAVGGSMSVLSGGALQAEFTGQTGNPTAPAGTVSTLTLNSTVAVNVRGSSFSVGTIPLISYTTLVGGGAITTGQLPQGVVGTIVHNTGTKTIELVISSIDPLIWTGATNRWDVSVTTNWTVGGTPTTFSQGDAVRFDDSAASSVAIIYEPVMPGSMIVSNNTLAYTMVTAGTGKLSGSTGLTKQGTNSLSISGTHDFSGAVTLAGGMLIANSTTALGSTNGMTTIVEGGTLDTVGVDLRNERITVSGSGYNGMGALVCSVANQNSLRHVTMVGDTTIGGVNAIQWGIQAVDQNYPYFVGNGYNLTKVGSGDILLKDLAETGLGDIEIIQDALSFQSSSTMGDPLKTCIVQSNGVLAVRDRTSALNKILVINGGLFRNTQTGVPADFAGPTTLNGMCRFQVTGPVNMLGTISGSGTLIKTDSSILGLAGANTYTGSTLITNGTIQLTATGSIANSTNIFVNTGATFDVSLVSGFALGAGQTISGNGTVVGDVTANGIVAPGASIGTLAFGTLTLAGTTVMEVTKDGALASDLVNASGALTYGGTLQVVLIGSTPLAVNDALDLFNGASIAGTFSSITLPAGYTWDTSQLAVDGTIRVASVIGGNPPQFNPVTRSGNNLTFSGSGGTPNGTFYTLTSTNVALPVANWTPIATNSFDGSGNFNFIEAINPALPRQFYLLQVP